MICNKCGKDNNSESKFCTQCGYSFSENVDKSKKANEYVNNVNYSNNTVLDNNSTLVRKKHTGLIITMIAILVIAIGVIIFLLLWNFDDKDKSTNRNNNFINRSNNISGLITKYDNYDVDVTMEMVIAGVKMSSIFTGAVDEVNQTEHFKVDVTSLGMTVSMESYSDFKNGYTYISDPIFNKWTRYSETGKTIDLGSILDSLMNSNSTTKIDDNHYKIVIDSKSIEGLMDTGDIDYDYLDGDVKADVYLNNGYINKIVYDMGEMMRGVSSFSLEMNISNYNNAGSIVIPDEVIQNAAKN